MNIGRFLILFTILFTFAVTASNVAALGDVLAKVQDGFHKRMLTSSAQLSLTT